VVKGIADGCAQAGCALIGGETAEMPGMYPPGDYDLAGSAVGVVEKSKIIDGKSIAAGDAVLGLASSGAHSNGYSLIRRIVAQKNIDLSAQLDGQSLSDLILAPTRIYVKSMLNLMARVPVKGLAHITGGGIVDNVPRILPEHLTARLMRASWPQSPLFAWLQREGNVAADEMLRVFNCGIGMVVVVAEQHAKDAMDALRAAGETVWRIGNIDQRAKNEAQTIVA
jgi:phosphoribosylformylglycinamidine cyclo-ligase